MKILSKENILLNAACFRVRIWFCSYLQEFLPVASVREEAANVSWKKGNNDNEDTLFFFFFPSWECLDTGVGCPESQWNISICGIFRPWLNKPLNKLVRFNVLCTRVWAAWPDRAPLQSELFCNSVRIGVFLPQDWHAQNFRHAVYFIFSKLIRKKYLKNR